MSLYIESVKRQRSCKSCGIELKKGTLYARAYDKSFGGLAFCSKCMLKKTVQLLKEVSDESGNTFSLSKEDISKLKESLTGKSVGKKQQGELVSIIQDMIDNNKLIIFHEKSDTLFDSDELDVSLNGDDVQIFIHRDD